MVDGVDDKFSLVNRLKALSLCFTMPIGKEAADEIERLQERVRELEADAARGDGWQPIETAPNEAWFLVHSDRGWIGLARRSDPDYAPDEGWFEDEHTEFLDPAWLTHWHPLPPPPAIDRARGEDVE